MEKNLKEIFGNFPDLDIKTVDFLTRALSKANLPGFDYLEFKQSLSALSEMHMDEEMAIKSTFTTAKMMGLTKHKLVSTAKHYAQVLDKEKTQFDAALLNQTSKRVEGKKADIIRLKEQVEKWREQVAKLEAQIDKSQRTIDEADEIIRKEQEKIEATRTNFENTYSNILGQIKNDLTKINELI